MRTLFALLLLTFATARAETLAEFVAARPTLDARQIAAALVAPSLVTVTNTVSRPEAITTDERRIRELVVTNLMTRAEWDERRGEARQRLVQRRIEQRLLNGSVTRNAKLDAVLVERQVELAAARVEREGGDPWGALSEQTTRPEIVTTPGPSWWDIHGNGQPLPTKEQLRAVLTAARAAR